MTLDAPPTGQPTVPRPSLLALLSSRARHASDGRLVADVGVGTVLLATILIARPSLWLLAMPAVCLATFGAWGIADRELAEHVGTRGRRAALATIRVAALLLGLAAAVAFGLGTMAALLGTWIS